MNFDRYLFVRAFVDEIARSGVSNACICPGSRSTPLAMLLREHPDIRLWTHLDERSASFFALGMAKAGRKPVAIVSTSGTAAVNFAPAVVEAWYARVPLVVLTADRPPELRDVGALQTIDQLKLYGPHVKWFLDMSLPETSADAVRYARTVACRAVATAGSEATAGPVHINFPFREPLVPAHIRAGDLPDPSARDTDVARDPGAADLARDDRPPCLAIRRPHHRPMDADLEALAVELRGTRRGLIVCGPQDDPKLPPVAARLADELRFPILADPLSLVRCGPHAGPLVIDAYDAFLRDVETAEALRPELILRFGAIPTSKPLLGYLQRHGRHWPEEPRGCRQLLVDVDLTERAHRWPDPALTATDALASDPRSFCEALIDALRSSSGSGARTEDSATRSDWVESWIAIARQTRMALRRHLETEPNLSEPGVFAELAEILPEGATLFAGNGMPVRDLDTFFPARALPTRFLANRGASGIDGVVSAALGASAAVPGPLVLVVGDLSFYHDMNGLLAARRHGLRATIVLLNNDGGGIFSFLPQADDLEHFEELFGAPHGLDFRPAAEMYGLAYRTVRSRDEFRSALGDALGGPGVTLVEVRTERGRNAELHRGLWKAVARSLREGTHHRSTR